MSLYRRMLPVPRYLVPLARRIDRIQKLVSKGVLIDSPEVIAEKLPDGRIVPRLRPGVQVGIGGVGASGTPIKPARPTTLNNVIAVGTVLHLWPRTGLPIPTTLNEVIAAGTTIGLWPTMAISTPTTLNEVITAGTTLGLWL